MPYPILNRRVLLINSSSSSIYDPDAVLYFDELDATGDIPGDFYKSAINQLVLDLKGTGNVGANDNWTPLVWCPIFATEYQSHARVSLKTPSQTQMIEVNSPMWTQYEGYQGDAATMSINTKFNPTATAYTQDNAAQGIYSLTDAATINCDMGAADTGVGRFSQIYLRAVADALWLRINQGSGLTTKVVTDSLGLKVGVRENSTTVRSWDNGTDLGTDAINSVGVPNLEWYLLSCNIDGSPGQFTNRHYAFAFASTNAIDVPSLTAAFDAFANTIGFAV